MVGVIWLCMERLLSTHKPNTLFTCVNAGREFKDLEQVLAFTDFPVYLVIIAIAGSKL